MRKGSKLAILLALVLSASATFTACDWIDELFNKNEDTESSETYTPAEEGGIEDNVTAAEEETQMNAVYKQRIQKWTQYVDYDAPETVQKATYTSLTEQKDCENTTLSAWNTLKKVYVVETRDTTLSEKTTVKKEVYNTDTHKRVYQCNGTVYNTEEKRYNSVTYAISSVGNGVLFEVETTSYVWNEEFGDYDTVKKYGYRYSESGEVLVEGLSEEKRAVVNGNQIDIADKTYIVDEEGIVKTFDKGMAYVLPTFATDNQQIQSNNYDEYVYFEAGEYGYYIDEEEYIATEQIGDLVMGVYPGLSIQVYKDYEMVASYQSNAYHVHGYGVLPNGNVYICEYRTLPIEASAYDLTLGGIKIDVVHTLLNVETGETSTLANNFVASNVFTNNTTKINTLLNLNTAYLTSGLKMKEGYVLAEIQKLADGAITGNSTYAVLNAETLAIVEELPKIVDSQFGYGGFVTADEMLIMSKTTGNELIRYTANVNTGNLELFRKNDTGIQYLPDGAFIYNKTVYDYEWNEITSWSDGDYAQDHHVLPNGKVLVGTWYDYYNYGYSWRIGELKEDNYVYNESDWTMEFDSLATGIVSIYENYFVIDTGEYEVYYDLDGKELFDTYPSSSYEYRQETTGRQEYDVTTTYTVYSIAGSDAKLVRERETWEDSDYNYYYGEVGEYHGKTFDQYFILK